MIDIFKELRGINIKSWIVLIKPHTLVGFPLAIDITATAAVDVETTVSVILEISSSSL